MSCCTHLQILNLGVLDSALAAQLNAIVGLVPLLEGSGINLDNGVPHQGLGADLHQETLPWLLMSADAAPL